LEPAAAPRPEPAWGHRARGVTTRIMVMALVVSPFNALFMVHLQGVRGLEGPTVVSIFYNVVFLLLLLTLVNHALVRWAPRVAFSPAELLSFFILVSVAACTAGQDTIDTTFGTIQGATYLASPENRWEDMFLKYLPDGMVVKDRPTLDRFWNGGSSIFDPANYRPWAGPMFRWWLFYSVMWTAPVGLVALTRRRWVESEKMTYPVVQLPAEMGRVGNPGFRHAAFWCALSFAVGLNLMNGLHQFYPSIPSAPVKIWYSQTNNLGRFFVGKPWNAVGTFYACFYPFITGLGILLPQELSLSLWLFYLLWKVQAIAFNWLGLLDRTPEFPYMKEQSWGGYLAMVGFSLWAARPYFRDVWRRITGRAGPEVDRGEPLPYRTAFLLFMGGMLYLTAVGISQRMAWWVSVLFFVQYYLMHLMVARMRTEMGLPTHEIERLGPTVMQGNILGPRVLGVQNLTSLSVFFSFTRGLRNLPMPHQAEIFYLESKTPGLDGRRLLFASMVMVPVGMAAALFSFLWLGYRYGVGTGWVPWMSWGSGEAWWQLAGWLAADRGIQWGRIIASVIGFGVYFGLMLMRTTFPWWPFHPAGFALGTTYFMDHMWFPMFLAYVIKLLVTRYLGHRAARGMTALAYGLILGDIGSGCLWVIYSLIFHVSTYAFWP